MEYLFYYMPPTPNKANTANFGQNIRGFFVKTELQHI